MPGGRPRRIPERAMPAVTLKAHYDGERILLDEPCDLPPDTPLMVTVLPREEESESPITRALNEVYGPEGESGKLDPFFLRVQALTLNRDDN